MEVNAVLDARWPMLPAVAAISCPRRAILHATRAWADRVARERLRHSSRELDQYLLWRLDDSDPETGRRIRELFGL